MTSFAKDFLLPKVSNVFSFIYMRVFSFGRVGLVFFVISVLGYFLPTFIHLKDCLSLYLSTDR